MKMIENDEFALELCDFKVEVGRACRKQILTWRVTSYKEIILNTSKSMEG